MAEEEVTPQRKTDTLSDAPLQKPVDGLPRIRTYAADMSKVIKARGETLASIVNKEQTQPEKRTPTATASFSPRRIAIVIGIAVLLIAGIGVLIGVFVFSPRDSVEIQSSGIIFANEVFTLSANSDGLLVDQLATIRRDQNLVLGEVMRVDVEEGNTLITGGALAARLGVPDALAREVVDAMIGIHAFDRNQPFIILRIATYDRSFGAMLAWERSMGRDLAGFFAPTNASGSAPLLSFTDEIAQNLDVRRSDADWPVLYTFPEQGLLIITTNEFTLREIMTRLSSSRVSL